MNNILNGIRVGFFLPAPWRRRSGWREAYQVSIPTASARILPARASSLPAARTGRAPNPAASRLEAVPNMLNQEPVHERVAMFVAMLRPLGIEKGKPFQPDARLKKILEEAAVVGEAMAKSLSYAKRQEEALTYPVRQW